MGVNLKDFKLGFVTPQCSECGVCLCWDISDMEYLEWKGFWDEWRCRTCNPDYKQSYVKYKQTHKPFEDLKGLLNKEKRNLL